MDGNYNFELQREIERNIQCLLHPNLHYPEPTTLTSYRVMQGNELIQLGEIFLWGAVISSSIAYRLSTLLSTETTIGGNNVLVFGGDGIVSGADTAGMYLCKAENILGSTNYTININVLCKFSKVEFHKNFMLLYQFSP